MPWVSCMSHKLLANAPLPPPCVPQEENPHFALEDLAASVEAFGAMVIDVHTDNAAFDEVEQELQEQEGQDSAEQRALAFDLARDHGSRWMRYVQHTTHDTRPSGGSVRSRSWRLNSIGCTRIHDLCVCGAARPISSC